MRFLGIDYGTKRVGLAFGDEIAVATPLPALIDGEETTRWHKLGKVIQQRRVTDLVLGFPYNMDGSVGFKAKEVEAFAARLRAQFNLPVHLVDETLTSYAAEATIAKKSRRAVRDSGLVDSRAACLILQDYLDQRFPPTISGQ
ncbi:MAG: Holliday junction resolvase RuvX [Opitutae bacterium]